jgi:hypothetical protein
VRFHELAARTAQLGTLTTKNDLALLYKDQGEYDRAEPLLRDCLALRQKEEPDAWWTFDST